MQCSWIDVRTRNPRKVIETQRMDAEIIERPGIRYEIQIIVDNLTSHELELNEKFMKAVKHWKKKSKLVNKYSKALESEELKMKSFQRVGKVGNPTLSCHSGKKVVKI